MKLSRPPRHDRALTLVELIVVIAILAVLAIIILPNRGHDFKKRMSRINCINNLKEIGVSVKIWESEHNDHSPQELSITNGGARERLVAGNVVAYFQIMSNELSTPKILNCLADEARISATSFTNLNNSNISYFVGLDANDSYPQMIMFGDDNLAVEGVPVKTGVMNPWTNHSVSWTDKRHGHAGNVVLADGSVAQLSRLGLTDALAQPGNATNLIVIP